MQQFKFDPDRVHPAYRKAPPKKAQLPVGFFIACLIIAVAVLAIVSTYQAQPSIGLSPADPRSIFTYRIIPRIRAFGHAIAVGNTRTFRYVSGVEQRLAKNAKRLSGSFTAKIRGDNVNSHKRVLAHKHAAVDGHVGQAQRPPPRLATPRRAVALLPAPIKRIVFHTVRAPLLNSPLLPQRHGSALRSQPNSLTVALGAPVSANSRAPIAVARDNAKHGVAQVARPPDKIAPATSIGNNHNVGSNEPVVATVSAAPAATVTAQTAAPPPTAHALRSQIVHGAMPVAEMPIGPAMRSSHHSGGYLNYDVFASPLSTYGIFGYGNRIGSGVAQVNVLARAIGENRGIMLAGLAWQRHSDVTGSTLTIGDSESIRDKYEESVRFDGVSYASRNLSYALGWERTDFGDSAMHFGSAVAQVTATKQIARRLTGEAHFFADASTELLGVGATWTTPTAGQLRFGLAPARGRGITGFFGYAFTSPRFKFSLDDRIWGAQDFDIGTLVPANYRQLRATAEYRTSPTDTLRVAYGTQAQGGFSTRTTTFGYAKRVGSTDLHVDLASSASGRMHNAGLATYISIPLGGGRSVTEQNALQGGNASSSMTFKQDIPQTGVGTGYALNYSRNGTSSLMDATVTAQTLGSTTKFDVSRVGNALAWNAEFSGSMFFFDGRSYATNQTLDQSQVFDALKGHGAATLTIVSDTGKPLPAGSIVRVLGESGEWRVDAEGQVEIDDIATGPQTLIVTLPRGTCVIGVLMPPNIDGSSYDLGKQLCARY